MVRGTVVKLWSCWMINEVRERGDIVSLWNYELCR